MSVFSEAFSSEKLSFMQAGLVLRGSSYLIVMVVGGLNLVSRVSISTSGNHKVKDFV